MKNTEKVLIPVLFLFSLLPWNSAKAETPAGQQNASMKWTSSNTSTSQSGTSEAEEVNPFDEMEKMQESMSRIFQESLRRIRNFQSNGFFEPNLDVEDSTDAYVLKMDLPGMEKENIHIDAADNSLTISGDRTLERTEGSKEKGFYRSERSSGQFSRTLPMPSDADMNAIAAKYHNGVLEITVPKLKKQAAAPATAIPVQ